MTTQTRHTELKAALQYAILTDNDDEVLQIHRELIDLNDAELRKEFGMNYPAEVVR